MCVEYTKRAADRLLRTSKRQVMSLQGDGVNVRKSSFSALLRQQQLRIPGLGMMGVWVGKGGGGVVQNHTPAR